LASRPRPEHLPETPRLSQIPGRWVDAGDLQVDDVLYLKSGESAPITDLTLREVRETVNIFHVEELHCFAVGNGEIVVQNNSGSGQKPGNCPNAAPVKEMKVGEAGHHFPSVRKSQGRPFAVERSDKSRPMFHVVGDEKAQAQAQWQMHNAEREHIGPRQGDFSGTDKELFDAYRKSNKDLSEIRVDVRSPDGKNVLSTNVTLGEAINLIENVLTK
jgi:hypothetical protein